MTTTAHEDATTATVAVARRHDLTATQLWVALASVFAGGIHLAVTAEHLEHWWVYGAFFIVTGLFQVAFAAGWVLRRPTWPVALTGIVVNLGIVLVWVAADLAATGAELALVCLLVTFLPPRMRRVTVNLLLATGIGLWALRLSGALG